MINDVDLNQIVKWHLRWREFTDTSSEQNSKIVSYIFKEINI